MERLYLAVPLLFAAVVLGMIVAPYASAGVAWLVAGVAVPANGMVDADTFTLALEPALFEDMNTGVDELCTVLGLEWLLPMGLAEVVEWNCIEPVNMSGTCESAKILADHLPWTTEVVNPEEGVFLDNISKGTGGAPGWTVECTVLGIKVTDECTTEHAKLLMTNTSEGLVEAHFVEEEPEEERDNCSIGGKFMGLTLGNINREALVNNVLAMLALSLIP